MKIKIITGSQRPESNSKKLGFLLKEKLEKTVANTQVDVLCLFDSGLPYWNQDKWNPESEQWNELWKPISDDLKDCDGFIFVAPEYNGMVPPIMTNFFLLCEAGELAHKAGLLVSVSAGNNGVYPISELRAYSFKNNKVCFIPEHLIIRNVNKILDVEHSSDEKDYIFERIEYTMPVFAQYAKALKHVRSSGATKTDKFGFGM